MEILATGVQRDERPLLERAFGTRHDIRCLDTVLRADTLPLAAGYEAVSTGIEAVLDAAALEGLVRGGTRLITQRSIGHNNIDLDHAERLGLTVANVAAYSPHSVAEFAFALATALNRRVVRAANRTRDGDFRLDGLLGRDLRGRTAGVIGTGRIGTAFAGIARGYGMRLLGWDITVNPACTDLGMEYVELDRLCREADLVSLHVPLMPSTHHLLGARRLAQFKEDALLVNTGRSALIDHAALIEALDAGRLAGVGLDVYEEEGGASVLGRARAAAARRAAAVDGAGAGARGGAGAAAAVGTGAGLGAGGGPDDPIAGGLPARLLTYPHVLVTCHQAYFTVDAVEEIAAATVRNVDDYLAGRITECTLVPRSP